METVAYWLEDYGRPLPNALKRGVADALSGFDDYALAKYRTEGRRLKMVDLVNLVHATSPSIDRLMQGTLRPPDTWEVKLTQVGGDAARKADEWARLVNEQLLGYFALLRNLRNLERWAPQVLPAAYAQLTDPDAIARSKVLPFRFITAAKQVESPQSRAAIAEAAEIALGNLPELSGRTLVALDVSGSMEGRPVDIGAMFAAALFKMGKNDVLNFGDAVTWLQLNPADTLTTIAGQMPNGNQGINFNLIFEHAKAKYDRIIILSDMQAWVGRHAPIAEYANYRRRAEADPAVWTFDLRGYGTLQFPERNVFALAGFSEKVFDLMPLVETGPDGLIRAVDAVVI